MRRTMTARPATLARRRGVFQRDSRDAWLVLATAVDGALVLAAQSRGFRSWPAAFALSPFVGLLICHVLNTSAHLHLHAPLFRSKPLNRLLSSLLCALTAVPQALWRTRHLAHHAGRPLRMAQAGELVADGLAAAASFGIAAAFGPAAFGGWTLSLAWALAFAHLQGRMEHLGGARHGVSYYGAIYNWLWFNDGYHAEHHRAMSTHWTALPAAAPPDSATRSALPPQLRGLPPLVTRLARARTAGMSWLVPRVLCSLERGCLWFPPLGAAMVRGHARAFARLRPLIGSPRRIVVIGAGLFPRSALALGAVFPEAQLVLVDARAEHLARARHHLACTAPELAARATYQTMRVRDLASFSADLVVIPLAFEGDRTRLWTQAAHPALAVHEWSSGPTSPASVRVSRLLCKRIRFVRARLVIGI
jgi:hypothetical protein